VPSGPQRPAVTMNGAPLLVAANAVEQAVVLATILSPRAIGAMALSTTVAFILVLAACLPR